ncbi:hypothetical protein FWK35_00011713 [Aphis craccivora]|uniref:Uncharacterized protein n=1 Tax=Aphis craccivora TaxID=307492 RepID=A0A6G0YM73_APHCR|nr:hypothetical protein FWK35_00011713 [Aphis craccivora]
MQRWSQIYRRTNKAKKNLGYETFHYNSAITFSNGVINIKCVYYHALKFKVLIQLYLEKVGKKNKSIKQLLNIKVKFIIVLGYFSFHMMVNHNFYKYVSLEIMKYN